MIDADWNEADQMVWFPGLELFRARQQGGH